MTAAGGLRRASGQVAVVTAIAYVWRHRTAVSPLVPRGTVRGRTGWALLVSLLVGVALVADGFRTAITIIHAGYDE